MRLRKLLQKTKLLGKSTTSLMNQFGSEVSGRGKIDKNRNASLRLDENMLTEQQLLYISEYYLVVR